MLEWQDTGWMDLHICDRNYIFQNFQTKLLQWQMFQTTMKIIHNQFTEIMLHNYQTGCFRFVWQKDISFIFSFHLTNWSINQS